MNLIHRTFLVVLQSRQVSRRSELCEWSRDSNGWIPGSSFCPRTQLWGLCDIPRSQARWGEWDKNKDNRPHLVQVTEGSPVLTNSYTLTPVPGAILHAGGVPVLGRVLDHQQHPLVSCSLQSSARRRVSKSTWKVWKSSRQPLGHVTCSFATWGASYQTWRASSSFAGGVNGDDCLILAGQVRELTKVESQGPKHHPGGRLCSCARLKVARQSPWHLWASWMLQHSDQQADQQVRKPENPDRG